MTTNYHHTEYISVCVYSSGSQYLTPEMYIITFHWKFLVICTFDLRVPFLLSKHLLFQSIKKSSSHANGAWIGEAAREEVLVKLDNDREPAWYLTGGGRLWEDVMQSSSLTAGSSSTHINIQTQKLKYDTLFKKSAMCTQHDIILFMHLSCAQQVRIWIWKWSNHYWICIYRLFMHKLNPTCTCNHESNLHMWNTSILVTIDFFPFW